MTTAVAPLRAATTVGRTAARSSWGRMRASGGAVAVLPEGVLPEDALPEDVRPADDSERAPGRP
ncbi:hypothetical protein [Streptomyces sp. NPDC086835]|uniref:hypothetical protein n=1 Tax=Streptomyces sp. NPDC086835 TaxID=3365761 RepID=UPI0038033F0C